MEFIESSQPSKSALKRAAKEVEAVAEQLAVETLPALDLPPELREEIQLAQRTKGHGARKRQIKHLAGLLRERPDELAAIQLYLLGESELQRKEQKVFHQVEAWRDRLCDPTGAEAALREITPQTPELDHRELTKLSRAACNGDRTAARKIFRMLREVADSLG